MYFTEREDAELAGAIRLHSQSQGVWLEAETLCWEDASHRLFSGPEETVAVTRDDGSQVTGVGLQVDVRRKTIRFSGPVSGTLVAENQRGGVGGRRAAGGAGRRCATLRQVGHARQAPAAETGALGPPAQRRSARAGVAACGDTIRPRRSR